MTGVGVFSNNIVQDEHFAFPSMFLTPAYYRTHPDQEIVLRRDGPAEAGRPTSTTSGPQPKPLPHEGVLEYQTLAVTTAKVQRAVRPQAVALALFALVVAATGLFVIAQAVTRQLFAEAIGHAPLSALGLSRHQLFVTAMVPFAVTAALGVALGIVVGDHRRRRSMPVGPARQAEPNPGVSLDLVALGGGGGRAPRAAPRRRGHRRVAPLRRVAGDGDRQTRGPGACPASRARWPRRARRRPP